MQHEAIHLSFTELWNRRTIRETNPPATWSHPDLSETVTQWQILVLKFVILKPYNLMPNNK